MLFRYVNSVFLGKILNIHMAYSIPDQLVTAIARMCEGTNGEFTRYRQI